MIALHRPDDLQCPTRSGISRHRDKLSVIELLIAEADDLWVTAVVLSEKRGGSISEDSGTRL